MWSSASPRPLPTMLLVCSTPMISLMCRLPIMRWSSALARFAGMNDAQRAAQRFQVWSSVARFGCSLPLLLTISASAFKLSNCTIPRLGIICAINSKLVRNSIACNSVSAKIRLPIWRLPRTYSSRHLCRPSKNFIQTIEGFEVKVPKMSKEELLEAFNAIRELKLKIDENMQKEKLRNINQQIEWVGNATGTNPDAFTSDRWNKAGFLKCVEAAAKATEDFSESTTDGGRLSQLGEIDSQLKEHTDTVAHLVKEEINKICTNLISTAQDN